MASLRTHGDGMDSAILSQLEQPPQMVHLKPSRTYNMLKSMTRVTPRGRIIYTVPKYIPKERTKPKYLTAKPREAKFVPYEPFKAAVTPIMPRRKKSPVIVNNESRNNIDIHDLVGQMADIRVSELQKTSVIAEPETIARLEYDKMKKQYDIDVKNLRETNSHLENQLKFQAQVNSELKTLLVAAVGEDLESRVQHLTEDKLQLARALLNSANHLTSHQEQTEWLSGLCEVWRSKFLASSLMVEELARWKSSLTNRLKEMQDLLKMLLEERSKLRNASVTTHNNLVRAVEVKANSSLPKRYNVLDVVNANKLLSMQVQGTASTAYEDIKASQVVHTLPESLAYKIIRSPVSLAPNSDAVCSAVMGAAAMSSLNTETSAQLLRPILPRTHCCSHCKGETLNI